MGEHVLAGLSVVLDVYLSEYRYAIDMRVSAIAFLVLAACGSPKPAVTVFAASSLKELVGELADGWSKRTGRQTRVQFESSSTLARQIKEGAAVDMFITAAPEWLEGLKCESRRDWLSNRLVCVVRRDLRDVDLKSIDSLALANEQVPAGAYAKVALAHQGVKIPERVLYGTNVRDVLGKVSQGGAAAGIVYATDAALAPDLRVAFIFPEESHPRIRYSVGVFSEAGRDFAASLRDAGALEAARRRGFTEAK